ncbi:MAG: KEOPS complex kinase/ATPase Bud32 [archaeon]|nr:KEOPS complex kinase/ATPase Bud32 [archaeon]
MKLIYSGAEASVFESEFLGKKCIVKQRISKKYRNPKLDERITKQRTKQEAMLIHKAKAFGVRSPILFEIDLKNKKIVMEKIEGTQLKKVLAKNLGLCTEIGKIIGILHKNNIVHGDLTTSNFIVNKKTAGLSRADPTYAMVALVDFGLGYSSSSFEDKATDLIGFKKSFTATHTKHLKYWDKILKAYEKESGFKEIEEKIKEIEARARYS